MADELKELIKMVGIAILTVICDVVFGYTIWYVIVNSMSFGIELLFVGIILLLLVPWNYFVFKTIPQTIKRYKEYKKNKEK